MLGFVMLEAWLQWLAQVWTIGNKKSSESFLKDWDYLVNGIRIKILLLARL